MRRLTVAACLLPNVPARPIRFIGKPEPHTDIKTPGPPGCSVTLCWWSGSAILTARPILPLPDAKPPHRCFSVWFAKLPPAAELPETAFALTGLTCRRLIFAPQPEIWPMPIVLKRLNHILFPVLPGLNCPGSAAGFRLKLPAGCVPADIRRHPPGWKPMISGPRMCCRLLPVPA